MRGNDAEKKRIKVIEEGSEGKSFLYLVAFTSKYKKNEGEINYAIYARIFSCVCAFRAIKIVN